MAPVHDFDPIPAARLASTVFGGLTGLGKFGDRTEPFDTPMGHGFGGRPQGPSVGRGVDGR